METLKKINRGHGYQSYLDALDLTQQRELKTCTHIILGFPWENKNHWMKTADELSNLPFHFLKIHQLHIVKDTVMGRQHLKKPLKLLTHSEYIDVVVSFLERLNPEKIIQRLSGEAPLPVLIAPKWGKRYPEIVQDIDAEMEKRDTWQGKLFTKSEKNERLATV